MSNARVSYGLPSHSVNPILGRIIVSESAPKDTILLIPPVKFTRYENYATGEVNEWLEFDPKAAGIITDVKP